MGRLRAFELRLACAVVMDVGDALAGCGICSGINCCE